MLTDLQVLRAGEHVQKCKILRRISVVKNQKVLEINFLDFSKIGKDENEVGEL